MASPCERCRRAVAPGAAFCAACGQPHHAGLLGALIDGRYQIEAFVGAGGMGRVYRAVHVALEREVAIKVLAPEVANRPELLERFRREAVATSRLAHPNVVGALDFGRHDGVPFFVMEWLDGDSLEALLTHGPLTPARALTIAAQIADALGAAHAHKIVHRDVKPGNVIRLRGATDEVKVVDFGLALLRDDRGGLTQAGLAMGTPAYLAPEQITGDEVGPAADVYALGGLLFELLVGEPAVGRGDPLTLLHRHLAGELPAPSTRRPTLAVAGLDELVARLLAHAPAARPPDGAAAAAAIREVLARLTGPSLARPLTPASRAVLVVATDGDPPAEAEAALVAAITAGGGVPARAVGDERFAHFPSSELAVLAAVGLAERLAPWAPRQAVHAGEVQLGAGGGLFGAVVNQALRIVRLARPGDVLVAAPAVADAGLAVGALLIDHGELHLGPSAPPVAVARVATAQPPDAAPEVAGRPAGDALDYTCLCGATTRIAACCPSTVVETRCGRCSQLLRVVPRVVAALPDDATDTTAFDAIAVDDAPPASPEHSILSQLAALE